MALRLTTWPVETVEHVECDRAPAAGRVECVICGKTYCVNAVVVDEVKPMPTAFAGGGLDVVRIEVGRCRLYCDHCNKIIEWRAEIFEGGPTRNVFGNHRLISSPKVIRQFLEDHPEAAGVQQR